LRRNVILGTDVFLEKNKWQESNMQKKKEKQYARGKTSCKKRNNVERRQEILTMIGLGFLTRIVTTISL
jgi:hypothetical protein